MSQLAPKALKQQYQVVDLQQIWKATIKDDEET
jgi:hypothetical protein